MISRCWFSFLLHVVPAQIVIQIFPSTLHCYENCAFHAHPLHISIITWPFQSPRYHWLAALHMPRLPAICRRPFRVFRERVTTNSEEIFVLVGTMALWLPRSCSHISGQRQSSIVCTILASDRSNSHSAVIRHLHSRFSFLSLGSSSARTRRLHHPFQT